MRKSIKSKGKRLRLSVFRSNKHIYAQLIDDDKGVTVTSASSLSEKGNNLVIAKKIGSMIALKAAKLSISDIIFDRGNYKFTGRVKALADAARDNGLRF